MAAGKFTRHILPHGSGVCEKLREVGRLPGFLQGLELRPQGGGEGGRSLQGVLEGIESLGIPPRPQFRPASPDHRDMDVDRFCLPDAIKPSDALLK